jgi:hypothetical protein
VRHLLVLALVACHHAPAPKPPPQVVVAKRPVCNLPELPGAFVPATHWSDDKSTVTLTREDWVSVIQYTGGLRDWIEAARPCLDGTFADDLNHFLGAR